MKVTFETTADKVNCPHCKGQNTLSKIERGERELICCHCKKNFYLKTRITVKHKTRCRKVKASGSDHKNFIKHLDGLWSRVIIAKAGFKSEISGASGPGVVLQAHHIHRKKNYFMRYHLENGICLERDKEHIFNGPHSPDPLEIGRFEEKVKELRGQDIFDRLAFLQKCNTKVDLFFIEKMLLGEVSRYE